MKHLKIPCPTCEGTGLKEIAPAYIATMELFKTGKKLTSMDTAVKLDLPLSAVIMRLKRLETWGFLQSEPQPGRAGTLYFKAAK